MRKPRTAPVDAGRRMLLRGAGGLALGLPFLASVQPRTARAATPPPRRLAILWENNGINMDRFWPTTPYGAFTEASFAADRGIAPLVAFREKLLIPRGLNMSGAGGHLGVLGLTAAQPRPYTNLTEQAVAWAQGPSVDRVLAAQVNPGGREPLILRAAPGTSSTVYGTLSYRGANQPVTHERNPWLAYRGLVGITEATGQAAAMLAERRKSVLDLVSGRLELLRNRSLSGSDRNKLDMHFTAVRELETRMAEEGLVTCELPADRVTQIRAMDGAPVNQVVNYSAIGRMHLDIIALAFACDLNRVAVLMFGNEAGGPVYNFDGLSHQFAHHPLSHGTQGEATDSGEVANYRDLLTEVDQWHARQMAYFLQKLESYQDETGSVLDNSAVVWMNTMSNGNGHSSTDMPVVMAGSLGGFFKTGAYVYVGDSATTRKPHNMLLTTLMNGMGVPETHFGPKDIGRAGQLEQLKT